MQSSLDPAAIESARVAQLFWWMAGGSIVIWCAVIALALYCGTPAGQRRLKSRTTLLIVGGGVVLPTLVLAALLIYGLMMLPPLVARAPGDALQVTVIGEQWWWRIRYEQPGSPAVELANEIRLPVDERVQFRLESDNVIHSFWIPPLGGKMDMIPGRVTYLSLHPTEIGIFRGICAEYCGASHAHMSFALEVTTREAFTQWLQHQAAPAQPPAAPDALRGQELFFANGCSACHRVSGTSAVGVIGPDLTHVASRHTLAAGALPNNAAALQQWLAHTPRIKPGVHMPRFGMLPHDDLRAIAAYLRALE